MDAQLSRRRVASALLAVASAAVVGLPNPARAEAIYTPAVGSPERQAIFDALRVVVADRLQIAPPVFVVSQLNVIDRAFAYVAARPVTSDGAPIDYTRTTMAEDWAAGFQDDLVLAFLVHSGGAWTVAEIDLLPSDWVAPSWADAYGAPRAIVESRE